MRIIICILIISCSEKHNLQIENKLNEEKLCSAYLKDYGDETVLKHFLEDTISKYLGLRVIFKADSTIQFDSFIYYKINGNRFTEVEKSESPIDPIEFEKYSYSILNYLKSCKGNPCSNKGKTQDSKGYIRPYINSKRIRTSD